MVSEYNFFPKNTLGGDLLIPHLRPIMTSDSYRITVINFFKNARPKVFEQKLFYFENY